MTYKGIVYISNEIRFILDTSRQVNLAAQNASLVARRAGNARGFQAVAAELKVFSQGLASTMHEMSQDILGIAQDVSGAYSQLRFTRYYASAARQATAVPLLDTVQEQAQQRHRVILTAMADKLRSLVQRLARSMRVCSNGRALARSAMIEATSGGEWESMLRNVAQDIERTIVQIHERLKLIGKCLNSEKIA